MKQTMLCLLCAALLITAAAAAAPLPPAASLDLTGAAAPYLEGDQVMVPLRAVAEALDYTVAWDAAQRAARVGDGAKYTWVAAGKDSYTVSGDTAAGDAPRSLGTPPAVIRGTTFVPLGFFSLFGGTVTVRDGVAAVTTDRKTVTFAAPVGAPADPETPEAPPVSYAVRVDGKVLDLSAAPPFLRNERVMVPLRAVGEALGCTVSWDPEARTALLVSGAARVRVTPGQDAYSIVGGTAPGMTGPQSLGAAPELLRGVTYVPVGLFELLGGTVLASEDGRVLDLVPPPEA